jgi:asparagine synthase (glutamine-hydrolysing)
MCGIAGIVSAGPGDLQAIRAMTSALRHRGPDDEGYVLVDSRAARACPFAGADTVAEARVPPLPAAFPAGCDLALGHRRLAIIDLSAAGHGPTASADGRFWITYNGEVFNYLELREELRGLGHVFHTATDTEVLLEAWAQWGPDALGRLNGMFAFGLYDAKERRLFCVRDRFGVKPLHYVAAGGLFAFASEVKGLLAHPRVTRRPDEAALARFLGRGAVDEGSDTFVEGIRRVQAGHLLEVAVPQGHVVERRWYSLPEAGDEPGSGDALRALLEDAVRLRLRSDVPVGTCLSGGLDSSSIVALTARLRSPEAVNGRLSFSVVYGEPGLDESAYIDAVVGTTGVEARRTTPTAAEVAEDLPAVARHQDEPFPSLGVYSQWRVMRLAREAGVTVLLDGQGADEVLAGYHDQLGPYLAEFARRRGLVAAWERAGRLAEHTARRRSWLIALAAYHGLPLPAAARSWAAARLATQPLVPASLLADPALAHLDGVARHRPRPSLAEELRADVQEVSLPALLRYEDRNSMAFSIEARTPFLDYRLVEAARRWRADDLLAGGWTKGVLREAVRGLVPETVRLRREKLGFATPETRWLAEMAPRVREWLGPGSRLAGRLRTPAVRGWLGLPDGELARRPGLVRLVSAELWLRHLEAPAC